MKTDAYSFKGWKLKEFLKGRYKLLVTLIGAVGTYIVTQDPVLSGIVGAGTELIVAILKYYIEA